MPQLDLFFSPFRFVAFQSPSFFFLLLFLTLHIKGYTFIRTQERERESDPIETPTNIDTILVLQRYKQTRSKTPPYPALWQHYRPLHKNDVFPTRNNLFCPSRSWRSHKRLYPGLGPTRQRSRESLFSLQILRQAHDQRVPLARLLGVFQMDRLQPVKDQTCRVDVGRRVVDRFWR